MGAWHGVELDDLELTGSRLVLRPWRAADAQPVQLAMSQPSMHRQLDLPDPYTRADAEHFVAVAGNEGRGEGSGFGSAVVERASGRVVGSAALRLPVPRPHGSPGTGADIGYAIFPAEQGRRYAAEAVRLLTDWAFTHHVVRVEIRCSPQNLPSARTALAAGFGFESIQRDALSHRRGAQDAAVFARVPDAAGAPIPPVFAPLPPVGLRDEELALRVAQAADATAMLDERSDPVAQRWSFTGLAPRPADVAQAAERAGLHWLTGPVGLLVMVELATGEVAGSMQLRLTGPPGVASIGYGVRAAFRGRRYTTRALRLLAPWAFGAAGLARLELGAKVANIASQRAALAAGFLPDGVRAARLHNSDGTFSDEARFALLRPAAPR
jgi:RimJ/RimL family protein N-acetyltransferase